MITQKFADVAYPLVREYVAKGLHISVPTVPVAVVSPFEMMLEAGVPGGVVGLTNHDTITGKPVNMRLRTTQKGVMWDKVAAEKGLPILDEAVWGAAVMAHETIHTALPIEEEHGVMFDTAQQTLGLGDTPTTVFPQPSFVQWFNEVVAPRLPPDAVVEAMPYETLDPFDLFR